jgi:hypothetical protein
VNVGELVDLHSLTHGAESFLKSHQFAATQELSSILWNPKVHTVFTRALKNPYFEPNQSNPYHPILALSDPF